MFCALVSISRTGGRVCAVVNVKRRVLPVFASVCAQLRRVVCFSCLCMHHGVCGVLLQTVCDLRVLSRAVAFALFVFFFLRVLDCAMACLCGFRCETACFCFVLRVFIPVPFRKQRCCAFPGREQPKMVCARLHGVCACARFRRVHAVRCDFRNFV